LCAERFQSRTDVQPITHESLQGLFKLGIVIVMLWSVNMEFCMACIAQKVWTVWQLLFHTKFRHLRRIVIVSLLFGKQTTFSPLLSSSKYVEGVTATALQFAASVSNQRLSVYCTAMAEMVANSAKILGSLLCHLVHSILSGTHL